MKKSHQLLFKWFITVVLFFILSSSLIAQVFIYPPNHPELQWESIETDHFVVNYHQGNIRTANLIAQIAEEIYPAITGLYDHEPSTKVEFIIRDTEDYANGGAYFFDNKIEIWAENLDYVLRGTHNWLKDVITHEFTHIISLQKALKFSRKIPAGWFQIFGYEEERRQDVVRGFPNTLVSYPISGITIPVWYAEGVAQYQSNAKRYDYRDSHREMILRDRVMTGNLLSLTEMGTFGKNSIGNESSYNQGFAFAKYLAEKYGEDVLKRLAKTAGSPFTVSFNAVIKKVTGTKAEVLHQEWRDYLKKDFSEKLKSVKANLHTGQPFVELGIGNMHPIVSPDGKSVAYLATGESPSLGRNSLIVKNLETGEKQTITSKVTGSMTWSPDGKYLAYAKMTPAPETQAIYNDLYIYHFEKEKEYQITRQFRARHPDWSHDGKLLTFVVESDGLLNLYTLELDETKFTAKLKEAPPYYYDLNTHITVNKIPENRQNNWRYYYREVRFLGKNLHQLTEYVDGRQIYHPRWSPDDAYIFFDTSIGYGRDIAKIPANGGPVTLALHSKSDERYPTFHPQTGELIYASDETGIFNIYSLNLQTGKKKAYTNVIGGAFMPSMAVGGDLFYSLYINQGYKIYRITQTPAIPLEQLAYWDNYQANIPELTVNQTVSDYLPSKPYEKHFSGVSFMPRVLIDYGTLKLGSYVYTNEILDKLSFFGGVDINSRKDLDVFGIFQFNVGKQKVFIELFNQTANIKDTLELPEYPTVSPKLDISFNLFQANIGFESTAMPFGISKLFYSRMEYIFSLYRAKLGTVAFVDPVNQDVIQFAPIRYKYLQGHAFSWLLRRENVKRELDRGINPRKGRYISFRNSLEINDFLDDFSTDSFVGIEEFNTHFFLKSEMNWEEYIPVPFTEHHALSLRFQGGVTEPVRTFVGGFGETEIDSFFHFFAGGMVGLKGYPFYSIEGTRMAIGSATYRFPLLRNINKQFLNVFFDKLYLGGFFQFGHAWRGNQTSFDDFLSDAGFQLRLDTFSWYFFPTKIFFEGAYPLKEHFNQGVQYPKEWKFYFGVLFDFDLRLEKRRLF